MARKPIERFLREPSGDRKKESRRGPTAGKEGWAAQDLNLEPTDYESAALTIELPAR